MLIRTYSFNIQELWGGLAAMLVALPQSIAFGILVFSALGNDRVPEGAVAGAVGAAVLGIMAPLFGGTPRLISSPCAPAAAFLAGLLAENWLKIHIGTNPSLAIPVIGLVVLFAGISQIFFALIGGGKIIKYIPYPVVSGYMSAVGLIIITGQLPSLLGVPPHTKFLNAILDLSLWDHQSIIIGSASIGIMFLFPRITKKIPSPIAGLVGGVASYFLLSLFHPENLILADNRLVVGTLQGKLSPEYFLQRISSIDEINFDIIRGSAVAGVTLAVVLSIDTLKTGVIVDTLSNGRSNSTRELIGQGLGNIATSLAGGIAGAGTLGATLVNISSGGKTSRSSILAGIFSLFAFIALTPLLAWLPVSAMAGILILVAFRTIDWQVIKLSLHRSTVLDFLIILTVIITALMNSLTAAAGAGFILSAVFFLRDQIRGSVIHRKSYGGDTLSRKSRLPEEMNILRENNRRTAIYQLQGNLFFGNTDQVLSSLIDEPKTVQFVIISLGRIQSFDSTAVHLFEQIESRISERQGRLFLTDLPEILPGGIKPDLYMKEIRLARTAGKFKIFDELFDALEWTEDYILNESKKKTDEASPPAELNAIEIFSKLLPEQLNKLNSIVEEKYFRKGETIFASNQPGDEIYFSHRSRLRGRFYGRLGRGRRGLLPDQTGGFEFVD